jgi:hypothetical protein
MSRRSRRRSSENSRTTGVIPSSAKVGAPTTSLRTLLPILVVLLTGTLAAAIGGKDKLSYGEGLIVNLPVPESEVAPVVEDITQNGLIRGTKEYNKDEFVSGAKAATSSKLFPAWNEGGKVFYKVREDAIDPRNFKDGGDVGTLVVRYIVQPQGAKNTVLRIDALFAENFRKVVHQSNGSVESAEYKDIQEHIEAIEVMKQQTEEANRERQEQLERKQNRVLRGEVTAPPMQSSSSRDSQTTDSDSSETRTVESQAAETPADSVPQPSVIRPATAAPTGENLSSQNLEERVKDLRKQVQRLVKAPGAPLKSAPFHTASTLETLTTGTEVLILISTPYWYGIETHQGQHGWIPRDELEQP